MFFSEPLGFYPEVPFCDKPLRRDFNEGQKDFPFFFNKQSELYVGYFSNSIREAPLSTIQITEEFLKEQEFLEISNGPEITKPFNGQGLRVTEIYFELPKFIEFYGSYQSMIDRPSGKLIYLLPKGFHGTTKVGIDGFLSSAWGGHALLIHNPSKYIKGVRWKDIPMQSFNDLHQLTQGIRFGGY